MPRARKILLLVIAGISVAVGLVSQLPLYVPSGRLGHVLTQLPDANDRAFVRDAVLSYFKADMFYGQCLTGLGLAVVIIAFWPTRSRIPIPP